MGEPTERVGHSCVEVIELQTKIRPDLTDVELEEGERLFIDRSSRVVEGKQNQDML